jgi:hypothetical protein
MSVARTAPKRRVPFIVIAGLVGGAGYLLFLGYSWLAGPGVSKYYSGWICKGYAGPNHYRIGPNEFEINGVRYPDYSVKTGAAGRYTLVVPSGNSLTIENRAGKIFINGNDCS